MRQMIGEVTERLDATEQHLARQLGAPPSPAGRPERSVELSDPDQSATPL